MSKTRTLLITDSAELRDALLARLKSDCAIFLAQDGMDGVAKALCARPNIAIVDLDLSDNLGLKTVETIRGHFAIDQLPIIAISRNQEKQNILTAVDMGASDYLIKTDAWIDMLVEKLNRWQEQLQAASDPGYLDLLSKQIQAADADEMQELDICDTTILRAQKKISTVASIPGLDELQPESDADYGLHKWINPFIRHTAGVFETMLGWKIKRQSVQVKNSFVPSHDVSGIISITGAATGTVVLSLSREMAFKTVQAILDKQVSQINEDVMDAVAELTNIVSGRASADLTEFKTEIGLPFVMVGRTKVAPFPNGVSPLCVAFDSPGGPLTLEVGLHLAPLLNTPEPALAT